MLYVCYGTLRLMLGDGTSMHVPISPNMTSLDGGREIDCSLGQASNLGCSQN
jgi:hypothetical protein